MLELYMCIFLPFVEQVFQVRTNTSCALLRLDSAALTLQSRIEDLRAQFFYTVFPPYA